MPVYEYRGLNLKGKTITDIIDADSDVSARNKLRSLNIFPVSVEEVSKKTKEKKAKSFNIRLGSRVKASEIAIMTRQLSTLSEAGFPLVSAFETLIVQTKSIVFKQMLSQIKDSIEEGNSFAASLSLYPDIFSSIYINMVRAGEASGSLEVVLERLADISEKQQAFNQKIRSAMAYPILMCFIAFAVLFFLLTYIVPQITSIFFDMDQKLPSITLFLIGISDFVKSFWWLIVLIFFLSIVIYKKMKKNYIGVRIIDRFLLTAPGISSIINKLTVGRFARTLGSLLENGVPVLNALDIVSNVVGNAVVSDAIKNTGKEVEKGAALGAALSVSKIFPEMCIQMIKVGEQSGKLESMLDKVANVFENEVESKLTSLTVLLEPVIILITGSVVGFIVLAILIPIFEMNQLVK
jgi:general secretion pathway protein F